MLINITPSRQNTIANHPLSSKKLKKYLELAKKLANKCDHRSQHVSFLVKKNKIIAIGTNKRRTDTFAFKKGYRYPSTHAELNAFKTVRYKQQETSGAILINVRVFRYTYKNAAVYGSARPCVDCLALAREAGVSCIYFTNETGEFSILK